MQDYRKLQVWEKSHGFVLEVYRATAHFPDDEKFGLTSQLRRAASSIPTNIAEGCGRETNADLARFLTIAIGSASEVHYLLLLSRDLNYLNPNFYDELDAEITKVRRMLISLHQRVKNSSPKTHNS